MKLGDNTVLITGGASGTGFALARRLIEADSRVIICGRRKDLLEKARREIPEICAIECDVSTQAGRLSLFSRITQRFPRFNVLINNASIQHQPAPLTEAQDWERYRLELAMNLEAPVHLALLFIPHLLRQRSAAIVNLTSSLAFSPLASLPGFSSTKAGLHSFSVSLREQLKSTPVEVFEVAPSYTPDKEVDAEAIADDVISALRQGIPELHLESPMLSLTH